jgi:hypothetical protein
VHYHMYSNAFAPPAMSFDPVLGRNTIKKVGEVRLEALLDVKELFLCIITCIRTPLRRQQCHLTLY